MRNLTKDEIQMVAGAGDECSSDGGGGKNDYAGVSDPGSLGKDLIKLYEGLVEATSYVMERVAKAL